MNISKEIALREIEEKIKLQRLKWFAQNYEKIYKGDIQQPEKIAKRAAELYNELENVQKEIVQRDKLAKPQKPGPPPKKYITFTEEDIKRTIMYPVPQPYLNELYGGGLEQGYKMYLKLRARDFAPYERYYDSQTQNMDYGWKVEEREERTSKEYARVEVIKPQFYRRYGVKGETLRNRKPFALGIHHWEVL